MLITPQWMMVVPRAKEGVDGISANGLAFSGGFFVKDEALFSKLQEIGPMNYLQQVGFPL